MKHPHSLRSLFSIIAALGVLASCASPAPTEKETTVQASPVVPTAATKAAESTPPPPVEKSAPTKAELSLSNGINAYENGDYKASQKDLQSALALGLQSRGDQIRANKYLAFIACASKQREVCKSHFLRILAINPRFNLSKAEAGHPVWGVVFKEARAESGKRVKEQAK